MSKILLMGAYPPPVGGNSVHIQRLKRLLDSDEGSQCNVLDIYSSENGDYLKDVIRVGPPGIMSIFKAIFYIRSYKPDILHIHVSAMGKFLYIGFFILLFTSQKTHKIITIHSGSFVKKCKLYGSVKMFLTIILLRKFNKVIAVSDEQKQFLMTKGISEGLISVLPAYIPTYLEKSVYLDSKVKEFRKEYNKILISSGYGVPLYGFDKIIPLINFQSEFEDEIGLIICLYNTYDESYIEKIQSQISDQNRVIIFKDLSPEEFSFLLKSSDVYVRATDRDGDAVAIREANHFNIPVLASDVVQRPVYCTLFELSSDVSLRQGLAEIFNRDAHYLANEDVDSILLKYKRIYGI